MDSFLVFHRAGNSSNASVLTQDVVTGTTVSNTTATITPNPVTFDTVPVGSVSPVVPVTITNTGTNPLFIEGGGITVSRFLAAGALDRLHVTIAPLVIGSGIPAFTLPETATLNDVLRFDWSVHRMGADLLVDIPLSRARPLA